jgi:chromosome segregation ATPase
MEDPQLLLLEQRSESISTLVEPNHSSSLKNGSDLTPEQLWDKLIVAEAKVQKYEDENIELRAQIAVFKDGEKEYKQQLETLSSLIISHGSHQKSVDLQRMYDQLLYKDGRIVELNNTILEKERQIMDLQEICREQGQVAAAKKEAVQIVNRRLQEIDARDKKDASTETDIAFVERRGSKKRVNSPGRAIPQLRLSTGNGSPPPLDPAEDHSSFTTETATYDDPDREWSPSPSTAASLALNRLSKKYRKKVTFDLNPSGTKKDRIKRENPSPDPLKVPMQGIDGEIAQQIIDLTTENDELRKLIAEIERAPLPEQQLKIEQLEEELENVRRNGKNQVLRARATAQAKIKELEGRIFELQASQARDVDSLNATNEALKASRDFILDENAILLEKIEKLQEKDSDLRSELEGANELAIGYRRELDHEVRKSEELRQKLKDANASIQYAIDEKQLAYGEVEKLKEAIFAQDELIQVLEGDLIVYETRVGLLQDSLGATKIEELQNVRAKAVSAKVNALEVEKQDIMKKRNDEKLLIKGLHIKIKCLEEERAELLKRIQKHENHEFQPNSLEDLRRADANRPVVYHSPSFVGNHEQQYVQQNHVVDNSQQHELQELQKQFDAINEEKKKLEAELAEIKASQNGANDFLGLLHAVEDIAMAPVFDDRRFEETHTAQTDNSEDLKRLEDENNQLKQDNTDLANSLQHAREKVTEMETVTQDASQIQNLLQSQKVSIQQECDDLKDKLSIKEAMLAAAQSEGTLSKELEAKLLSEMEELRRENSTLSEAKEQLDHKVKSLQEKLEEIETEKQLIENKIYGLEKQNIGLAESNEKLSKFETENNRLDDLVSNLRIQVEQFQVEAELSRTCLDDLRRLVSRATNKNVTAAGVQRIPSIDETNAMKTALEALNASLPQPRTDQISYQQAAAIASPSHSNQPQNGESVQQQQSLTESVQNEQSDAAKYVEMSQASSVHMPSESGYSQSFHEYPQASAPIASDSPIQAQYYQQQEHQQNVQNPYVQSHINTFGYQQQAPVTTYANHSQPEQTYYQQVPQHQQEAPTIENNVSSQKLEQTIEELTTLQVQYSELQKSYNEMQHYYKQRERELLEQKDHFEHRATNLSGQLAKAENKIEESFKENVELENENYTIKEKVKNLEGLIKQLEETKTKAASNDEELCHLRKQMETMDNDFNHLKDTNKKLEGFLAEARTSQGEAEETRNSLASENRQLRETLESLQKALNEAQNEQRIDLEEQFLAGKAYEETSRELEIENAQLRSQLSAALNNINDNTESVVNSTLRTLENNFDDSRPKTFEVETQCQIQDEEAFDSKLQETQPEFSDMLKDYVKETTKFTDYLSQDVESLFVLNEELANAADSLRGQVWALNQQLKKSMLDRQEILEQIERLETENLNTSNENLRLKQELSEQQEKLSAIQEQSTKWKSELSLLYDKKAEVDAAYGQLSDNYSQLQEAYNKILQKLSIPKIDGSTDPLVESDLIDSAETIKNEYSKLEQTSQQMRAELELRSEKIRHLEQQITLGVLHSRENSQLSNTTSKVEEQARGEKATAHWTMLEIKKLLVEAADTLQRLPIDEAYEYVRRETEVKWSEKVHKAITFCETVITEMQKCDDDGAECTMNFKLPEDSDSVGIESVILKLHERWRLKHHQLLESSNNLQSQRQICQDLESRLSDAHEKLAEIESQRSSNSSASRSGAPSPVSSMASTSTTTLSPSMTEFWNRLLESFSQSCRATASVDMRLSSTNNLIQNALKQLDSSSNDANKAMVSAKLQFAILAARLTAKQADNDALFRATAELAHTNVTLQNELDDLQEKLVESHEKDEKETPESNTFVDASFKKIRQGAKTRSIISSKTKIHDSIEKSVILPSKPKSHSPKIVPQKHDDDSWGWNEEANEQSEDQNDATENTPATVDNDEWGWNEKEETPSVEESVKTLDVETALKVQTTSEDLGDKEKTPPVEITITSPSIDNPQTTTPAKDDDWGVWDNSSHGEPTVSSKKSRKAAKKSVPKPKGPESTSATTEATTQDWGWDAQLSNLPSKKSSKPSTRESTPVPKISPSSQPPPDPTSNSDDWGWGEPETATTEKDSKVSEWAWNEDEAIDKLPKRPTSQASSVTSKTSKASTTTKKSVIVKPQVPPLKTTTDDWGWNNEEETVKEPPKPKQKTPPKKVQSKQPQKSDDKWGLGDEKKQEDDEEATDDWGW